MSFLTCSGHGDSAGTNNLLNADGFQDVNNCLNLGCRARYLNCVGFWADIHDLAAEYVNNPQDFGPGMGLSLDPDQDHLPLNVFAVANISNLDDIDKFVQLFGDLLDNSLVAT